MQIFFLLRLIEGVGLLFVRPLFGFHFSFSLFSVIDLVLKVCIDWADIADGYLPIAYPPTFFTGTNEASWATVFNAMALGSFFCDNTFLASSSSPYVILSLLNVGLLLATNFQLAYGSFDFQIFFYWVSCSFFLSYGSDMYSGFFINYLSTLLVWLVVIFFGWVHTLPF